MALRPVHTSTRAPAGTTQKLAMPARPRALQQLSSPVTSKSKRQCRTPVHAVQETPAKDIPAYPQDSSKAQARLGLRLQLIH